MPPRISIQESASVHRSACPLTLGKNKITGYSKKSVSWAVQLFFDGLYCCFIQTWCINNGWKCDFWHLRCLFYQVESILFHFQQLQIFVFQKFPWNTAKMVKNLQCLKSPRICYLTHAEHHAKKPHVSTRSRSWYTFFWITPYMKEIYEEIKIAAVFFLIFVLPIFFVFGFFFVFWFFGIIHFFFPYVKTFFLYK